MSGLALTLTFDGHRVRMAGTPERPEWVAKDVCRALYIHNSGQALSNVVPDDERGLTICDTPGGPQQMATITEPGLYRLVLRSRKPAAERFRTWMVRDVIPCIRKHGCYPAPAGPTFPATALDLRDPKQLAALALQLTQIVAEKDERIAVLEPKAEAHDRLSVAHGDVSLSDAIRILGRHQKGTLILWQADGLLFRGAHGKLIPAAEHRDRGVFRVRIVEHGEQAYEQTLVTPAGLQWLAARYPADMAQGRALVAPPPSAGGPRDLSH